MKHLSDTTLAALVDDQRSHPHLDTCPSCHARADALRHLARNFLADPASAPTTTADPATVHAIMSRIHHTSTASRPTRRTLTWVFAAAAVAVAVVATLALSGRDDAPTETYASRGSATENNPDGHALVTPFLHPHPSAPRATLTPGMTVDRGFALSFRAIAPASPIYLLIAGCDARGDLHWALPVWRDPASDPHGLRLSPDVPLVDLPDALLPDAPPGPFDVLVITSREPIGVQSVERALAPSPSRPTTRCDPHALREIGPETLDIRVVTTPFVVR